MDSPAPMWTKRTSQETRSHSLMPIPPVSRPILKNEAVVALKPSLDNASAWSGCTWTLSLSMIQYLREPGGRIGPYPWAMHLLDTILVAVSGFTISGSLDQLGSCGLTALLGRDQRLDFEWEYFGAFLSKMVWVNRTSTMLRSVIFSCTWIIAMIKVGDPIEDPRGLMLEDTPCRYEVFLEIDSVLVGFSLAGKGTKVSMRAVHMHCLVS